MADTFSITLKREKELCNAKTTALSIHSSNKVERLCFSLVSAEKVHNPSFPTTPESSSCVLNAGVSPRVGIMGDCSEKTGKHTTAFKLRLH